VIGVMTIAGLGPVPVAHAAPAATDVPCSVAALVSAMSGAASGATLSLAAGCRYRLTAALPVVAQDLTILGNEATVERSYAPGTAAFTILTVSTGTLTVTGLNFRHGNGAIAVTGSGLLTVNGGIFTGNTAADGGAISDVTDLNGPVVTGAVFTRNTATDAGGAIYVSAAGGGPRVTNSTFTRNTAAGDGGAIFTYDAAGGDVAGSTFQANTAGTGGALFLSSDSGETLSHDVVRSNSATGNAGGVFSADGSDLTVDSSTISGNHAGGRGGGIYLPSGVFGIRQTRITGTDIQGNSAADGGGVYNPDFAEVAFTDSRISGNSASAYGGGIYNAGGGSYPATASFTGSVISGNNAGSAGGGIYGETGTTTTLANSSVLRNVPDNCDPPGSIAGCTGWLEPPGTGGRSRPVATSRPSRQR